MQGTGRTVLSPRRSGEKSISSPCLFQLKYHPHSLAPGFFFCGLSQQWPAKASHDVTLTCLSAHLFSAFSSTLKDSCDYVGPTWIIQNNPHLKVTWWTKPSFHLQALLSFTMYQIYLWVPILGCTPFLVGHTSYHSLGSMCKTYWVGEFEVEESQRESISFIKFSKELVAQSQG